MVANIVGAHPEAPGGLAGREEPLGGPGEARELPGEAGMGEALEGRHAVVLDGAALEERREILHRQVVDQSRLRPQRLEVERAALATAGPDSGTVTGYRSGLRSRKLRPGPA